MFNLSKLSSLQLFQLMRYGTFVLIGICFAKLQLSQSVIGQFETFILVSGMVSFFWVSGIINSMLSIYPKKNEEDRKAVLFNTFVSLLLLSVLAATLLFTFSQNLLSFLDKEGAGNLVKLAVVYLLLNNPSFLVEYILFLNEKKKAIIIYGFSTASVTVAAVVVPVVLGYGIEISMYGLIAVAVLRIALTVFLLNRFANFKFDSKLQLTQLKLSLPLIASIFVSGSAEYIDGLIVKAKFNDMFFTLYRYGAKELPVLLIIANTFSTAMIPAIASNLENGLKELKEKSGKLMHIFFPLTILLLLVSPLIFRYMFSDSFVYSAIIFNIYLLLIIPRVLFPQTILTGMQQTKYLLVSSVLEIVINVSLSIYLAGKIGLPGIAAGTFIAYTFDKLFLMSVNYFVYGIKPSAYIKLIPFVLYTVCTFAAFAVGQYLFKIGFWGF